MWKISITVLLFGGGAQAAPLQNDVILENQIRRIQIENQVPALGAILWKNGAPEFEYAVGLRKWGNNTPVTVSDQFHLGSCTKAMTATLVGLLVDEGRLSWKAKLVDLLPDISKMHPKFKNVSLEMLLAHRSGIPENVSQLQDGKIWDTLWQPQMDPSAGRQLMAKEALSRAPASEPGSQFEYSNVNYMIVGAVLEKTSNMPWERLMRERLFQPLGMNHCGFGAVGDVGSQNPSEPWAHHLKDGKVEALIADNVPSMGPAATVHCSLEDWAKFVGMHVQGFNGTSHFLSKSTFEKLHAPYPGQNYTYGGWIRTEKDWANGPAFTHEGSNLLNYASVWWAPKKNFAVMTVTNIGLDQGMKAAQQALGPLIDRQ